MASPVIGRICGIIGGGFVTVEKLNEPGVFNPAALIFRYRKNDSLRNSVTGMKAHLIIGICKPSDNAKGFVLDSLRKIRVRSEGVYLFYEFFRGKFFGQTAHNMLG